MKRERDNRTEAFWLMTYTCQNCGEKVVIWNSCDGVTPFGTRCIVCGESNMLRKGPHEYKPNYVPQPGQCIWIGFPVNINMELVNNWLEASRELPITMSVGKLNVQIEGAIEELERMIGGITSEDDDET